MPPSWQQQQTESARREQERQERVSRLVQAIHDLLDGQPLDVAIEAVERALRGLYRLREEGK